MDKLRIVPAAEYSEEAIKNISLINAVSIGEHPAIISSMNDSRVIPATRAVFEQYVISIISIRSPSLEDIFIYQTGKGLDGGNGNDAPGTFRRRLP
jgi:ABC-2 type transport system ATP-binding protein